MNKNHHSIEYAFINLIDHVQNNISKITGNASFLLVHGAVLTSRPSSTIGAFLA